LSLLTISNTPPQTTNRGFNAFLWLLRNTEAGPLIKEPGYMATLIAPHDTAVDDALSKIGTL